MADEHQDGKVMSDGYGLAPDLEATHRRELHANLDGLHRTDGMGRAGRKDKSEVLADPRAVVAREFMRMSEAHDRIRSTVLSARLPRDR